MMTTMESPIQLVDLSEELTKLWDMEQGQKKIRASLFNFILYVEKTEKTALYQSLIKSIVSKFPCRVIFIMNNVASHQEFLRTSVSSETIGEGALKVFCEIIQIEVSGKFIERVPYMILPQILPDLPVYLLWTQDPTIENTVLPHLEPLAHRIIFNPISTPDLQSYSRSILSLMHRFHCGIGDLSWSALSGWRSTFVQVFNSQESFLSLAQTHLIRIHYNESNTHLSKQSLLEAAYLQAWLASKMNWKFQTLERVEGNIRLTYLRPLKEIVILLTPQANTLHPQGSITSIEIESVRNKGIYYFEKEPSARQVIVHYSEKDFCQLPFTCFLSGAPAGQEILEELFHSSGGMHYKDTLEVLSVIPWNK